MVVVPFEAISDRPARFAGNVLLKAKTKNGLHRGRRTHGLSKSGEGRYSPSNPDRPGCSQRGLVESQSSFMLSNPSP
jgi:hypothetical protein